MKLTNNVYLLKGKARACIYDLNKRELYSINIPTYDAIEYIIGKNDKCVLETQEINDLKKFLIENELVDKSVNKISDNYIGPSVAFIELTTRCNHKCVHCYNEKDKTQQREMDLSEFYHSIDEIKAVQTIKTLKLTGGEPLLLKTNKFLSILSYIDNKFDNIEILSNLSILPMDIISKIKSMVTKVSFSTSLFSTIPEEFDKCTQVKGSFLNIDKNIQLLKK